MGLLEARKAGVAATRLAGTAETAHALAGSLLQRALLTATEAGSVQGSGEGGSGGGAGVRAQGAEKGGCFRASERANCSSVAEVERLVALGVSLQTSAVDLAVAECWALEPDCISAGGFD